jgi:hypothetical protein
MLMHDNIHSDVIDTRKSLTASRRRQRIEEDLTNLTPSQFLAKKLTSNSLLNPRLQSQSPKPTANMSHQNPSHGQKVKSTDPADTIEESTGPILSDSLAAESLEQGGEDSFASGHATASKQSARGTTTNNYDTSGATTLEAAPDAEARMATEEWSENAALKAGRGLSSDDYSSGGSYTKSSGSDEDTSKYSAAASGAYDEPPKSRPHGRDITEGGFDDSAPNASFNQDIGGKNDPGRLAEQQFAKSNARNAATAGFEGGREETEVGSFDKLGEESA